MALESLLSGGAAALDPAIVEDILADDSPAGILQKRGKVLYHSDFENRGYDGFLPVFNKAGGEGVAPNPSLVNYPGKALRLAAPGSNRGQGLGANVIKRLSRPRMNMKDYLVSVSFYMAIFNEYEPGAGSNAGQAKSLSEIVFGLDTQGWEYSTAADRQFFSVYIKNTTEVTNDRYYVRVDRAGGGGISLGTIDPAILAGATIGANENKKNWAYVRLTVRAGQTPEYVELQIGGRTLDLRNRFTLAAKSEPLQDSTTDYNAPFRGGMNPFFGVTALSGADTAATGMFLRDVVVTYGDKIA